MYVYVQYLVAVIAISVVAISVIALIVCVYVDTLAATLIHDNYM
jgi:hypothetical protein